MLLNTSVVYSICRRNALYFLIVVTLYINNIQFAIKANVSILDACKSIGIIIPRFCYNTTLSIAGNCRLCLIELKGSPKPVASCALPVLNNMQIFSNTPLVKKARENILELLLINHPLDCPICDQGGECDLQDQAQQFGLTLNRHRVPKRSIENKKLNIFIKTIMTRCIQCTRCVRYTTEILGTHYLGTLNRGTHLEIGSYIQKNLNEGFSANLIDLCPVGALTSKHYAFKTRPWELRSFESIDLLDGFGSNIYINFKENEILRIIPKFNKTLNDNFLSDSGRYFFDSLKQQRLYKIFLKQNKKFLNIQWSNALEILNETILKAQKSLFIITPELDITTLSVLKRSTYKNSLFLKIKSSIAIPNYQNFYNSVLLNKVTDFSSKITYFFLFSINLKIENILLNYKIKLKTLHEKVTIFNLTNYTVLPFLTKFINLNLKTFLFFLEGKSISLSKLIIKNKCSAFLLGESLYKYGITINIILEKLKKINQSNLIFNISTLCNSAACHYLNFKSLTKSDIQYTKTFFFFNNINKLYTYKFFQNFFEKAYWFNSHGSEIALKCKLIIPITATYEESGIFLNLEHKPQKSYSLLFAYDQARSLKSIFNILFNLNNSYNISQILKNIIQVPSLFYIKKYFSLNLFTHKQYSKIKLLPIKVINQQINSNILLLGYSKNCNYKTHVSNFSN
jgi:NADH-quinone oxidoreductase subunit G